MRTRSLLVTLLVAPALAAAQTPIRPPRPGPTAAAPAPTRPQPVPPGALPGRPLPTTPVRPTTAPPPGATPSAAPSAAGATPAGAPLTPVKPGDGCKPIQGKFLLSFNKTDIVDMLEQASRWTCRNFIYAEDVAKGKITLLSKSAVTADEAYAAFLAALASNGIAVYQTGRYWKLVRIADAKKNPIPTYTTDGDTPANEQPITKVIRLKYADADQVRGIMGNFISPQGADIQSLPPDTLIITDFGLNIRRIEKLIDMVDRAGGGEVVKLVQVRYAAAKDIADKVNQVFSSGSPGGKGKRTVFSAPSRATSPVAPGTVPVPAAPAGPGSTAVEVQVTKVIPDDRTNKLIIIADEKSFERIMELVQQLDVPTAEEGGIHVVYLKHANAEEMATTLSNLAQGKAKGSGPTGAPAVPTVPGQPAAARPASPTAATAELFTGEVKITADKAQNALVIQASGADIVTVRRLIDKLDRPRRQVFIEAVIMEVNLRNDTAFGVGGHGAVPVTTKDGTGFIPIGVTPGRINTIGPLANVQNLVNLGGFLTGYSGPVSASLKDLGLPIPSIGVMVQALQSNSDVNVLSTPHLLASDNEESEITVGQNVPFQTGFISSNLTSLLGQTGSNANNVNSLLGTSGLGGLTSGIQRQPVELRLKIKPQISAGDNVRLIVDEQTEEIVDKDPQLGPTTAKRSIKTQVVARDQGTIVIGGLVQERNVRSVKKVPFLGSLPLVGWLFRDTSTTKQKTNLLLFLTPYIIRDEADYRRIYEKKRQEQQDFLEQFYGRRSDYEVGIDFNRKAGPYARLRRDVEEEIGKPENGGHGGPGEKVITAPGGDAPAPGQAPRPPAPGQLLPLRPEPLRPPDQDPGAGPDLVEPGQDVFDAPPPEGAEPPQPPVER